MFDDYHHFMVYLIERGKNLSEILDIIPASRNSIRNWMKKLSIKAPTGFYRTGKRVGRPPGFKHSDSHKRLMSERFSGENNPFFGAKHSEDTKHKMSKNHARLRGDSNPFKIACENPEFKKKHKERCLNIWKKRDVEYRNKFAEKLSIAQSRMPSQQLKSKYKCGFYRTKAGSVYYYRSSWELLVLEDLDNIEDVKDFSLEKFTIPYYDNIQRHTRIDFYIEFKNGRRAIVEVKPTALIDYCVKRMNACMEYCHNHDIQFFILDSPYFNGQKNRSDLWEELKDGKFTVRSIR